MTKNSVNRLLIASTIAAAVSGVAHAHEKGDVILRAGLILVEPQEKSTSIDIQSPDLGIVAGAEAGVKNNIQIGITAAYMLTDEVGIELLAATPFSHDIYAGGAIAGVGKLGETKHLPPTLSLQYYFPLQNENFRPYIGAGLNYTLFFQEKTTDTLTSAIGVLASLAETPVPGVTATSTTLKLKDSLGVSLQAGFDYAITDQIGINASMWWMDIDTEATITAQTNAGVVTAKTDVSIDPYGYLIGASYTF